MFESHISVADASWNEPTSFSKNPMLEALLHSTTNPRWVNMASSPRESRPPKYSVQETVQ